MKILKIFGVVVGIHIFALILIFANPGCSSTTKPPPAPSDTVAKADTAQPLNVPNLTPAPAASSSSPPLSLNLDGANASAGGEKRFVPTRPNTPAAGTLVSQPVTDVTPATTYTVVSGDNLSKIAKKTHTTIAELAAANGVKENAMLRPGQKLLVPGKPAAPSVAASTNPPGAVAPAAKSPEPAAAVTRAPGETLKHTVKQGETLGAIARKYQVRVADIAVANNISDPAKIRPGQELIIPGFTATAGPSGKNAKSASQKSGDTRSAPPAEQAPAPQSPPTTAPLIPVAPVDDNPLKPAPRP